MKRDHFFVFSLVVFLGMHSAFLFARQKVDFATLAPKSSSWGKLIKDIAREVYKRTDKEILLKVFYGGVQGDETEMEAKIRFGQLQGGFFTGNGLGLVAPEARILEIPGIIKTYKVLDYVYDKILPVMEPYFNKRGYVLLGLADVGYAYFYSKQDIRSIKDIGDTKMWLWKGDQLVADALENYGIPGVAVHFTEVIPSLKTGLIDGVYATPTALVSLQWHKQVRYMLDFPITLVSSGVVLSLEAWKNISKERQGVIAAVVKEQLNLFKPKLREADGRTLKLFKNYGIKINFPNYSREQLKALEKKTAGLLDRFPASLQKHLLELIGRLEK